jgi:hypothetical protein
MKWFTGQSSPNVTSAQYDFIFVLAIVNIFEENRKIGSIIILAFCHKRSWQ